MKEGKASRVYWQPNTSGATNAASVSMYTKTKNRAEIFRVTTTNSISEKSINQPSFSFYLGDEQSLGGAVIALVEHNRSTIRFYDTKREKYYKNGIEM